MNNRTCNNCGWVHFGVTRAHAAEEVARFNEQFYPAQKSSITQYERCERCGGSYLNFRVALSGDCPDGCTIGPIIVEAT